MKKTLFLTIALMSGLGVVGTSYLHKTYHTTTPYERDYEQDYESYERDGNGGDMSYEDYDQASYERPGEGTTRYSYDYE